MKNDTQEMKAIDTYSSPDMVVVVRLRATVGQIESAICHEYLEYLPDGHLGITKKGLCIL